VRFNELLALYEDHDSESFKALVYDRNPFLALLPSETDFLENTAKFAYPSGPIPIVYGDDQ